MPEAAAARVCERAEAYYREDPRVRGVDVRRPVAGPWVPVLVRVDTSEVGALTAERELALEALGRPLWRRTTRTGFEALVQESEPVMVEVTVGDLATEAPEAVLRREDPGFWLEAFRCFGEAIGGTPEGLRQAADRLAGLRIRAIAPLLELQDRLLGPEAGRATREAIAPLTYATSLDRVPLLKALMWAIWLYRHARDAVATHVGLAFPEEAELALIERMVAAGGEAVRPLPTP